MALFRFTATPGTTDDARIRDVTQAQPPRWADRLFEADAGATEQQLQRIAAEGLSEVFFRTSNTRLTAWAWCSPTWRRSKGRGGRIRTDVLRDDVAAHYLCATTPPCW
ncbi:hypothetical protein ACF1G5_32840 [Streptomyces coeruleorubidus]|uniref:hypothetical protein n=1 Tax=Streptomyces coeruleorubidus TaxID=116188 RepID=UPI0036FA89F6